MAALAAAGAVDRRVVEKRSAGLHVEAIAPSASSVVDPAILGGTEAQEGLAAGAAFDLVLVDDLAGGSGNGDAGPARGPGGAGVIRRCPRRASAPCSADDRPARLDINCPPGGEIHAVAADPGGASIGDQAVGSLRAACAARERSGGGNRQVA